MTRQRIFLETMEAVLKNSEKIIVEGGQGVVPYLPLNEINRTAGQRQQGGTQ